MYLVDWEYAGMNDFMWDLADVSIEAMYDSTLDELLLTEYFNRDINWVDWKHFLPIKYIWISYGVFGQKLVFPTMVRLWKTGP